MRRLVLVQLVLFALVSVIVVPFAINYVIGPQAFGTSIRVYSVMTDARGLTAGTAVTYRGVSVGEVASVRLEPDQGGARVDYELDPGVEIPVDSVAKVGMGTAAGIQNVDIFPNTGDGPFLQDGDLLPAPADQQPVQMGELMTDAAALLTDIDPQAISDIGTELGASFDGLGPALASMIDNGDALTAQLEQQAPMLTNLLSRTATLVTTMSGESGSFVRGMGAARSFTEQLDSSAPVLVYLADTSPAALDQAHALFDRYHDTFAQVLANLVTVAPVLSDRQAALASGLNDIPQGLGKLESIVTGDRANFTLIGTLGQVCNYDTVRRAVGDESPTSPNLTYYCPPQANLAQRGSRNAPRPNDLGLQNATSPGTPIGYPPVEDPILIPTGTEALDYWNSLLEDLGNGQ